jgi:hypothetical protein
LVSGRSILSLCILALKVLGWRPRIAADLFYSVEEWVHQRGMTFMRGSINASTNYEVGLLMEGFDYAPALMMTYNPPYQKEGHE